MYISRRQSIYEYLLLACDISKSVAIHFDETVLYYHLYLKIEEDYQWSRDPDIMAIYQLN